MDLSNSLGTLRSQKKTKLDSFRRRDRMVKQITPPRDIPFLKSGLSLVGEEHGKVGMSASNLWFLCSLCKCEKIIKAVKFQKVGLSLLALNKCISYEFTFPQNQKKSKLIYRA